MDFLKEHGAMIDTINNQVFFFPQHKAKVDACKKPLLAEGVSAASATPEAVSTRAKTLFTVSPIKDVDIPVNDFRKFKVQINTEKDVMFRPGCKIIVDSCTNFGPMIPEGIFNVGENNQFSLPLMNNTSTHLFMKKGFPVQGVHT